MNPNIGKEAHKGGPKTEVGKFMASIGAFKESKTNTRPVPKKLAKLYLWFQGKTTKNINFLLELQNLYEVLKYYQIETISKKILSHEELSKKDFDALKLLKDTLVESNKIKYGDKKIIENVVSVKDVRAAIFSENLSTKKIVNAEVIEDEPVSQDLDRSGRGERTGLKDGKDKDDNKSPTGS
ncbi:hypothetical protein LCGC14_2323720 [marine sediment metagenome]|uniref:Uncharacterized protein n=1 Tax=marine sediment metagenome TaxID=412755 RepID=A0A0F9D4L7_9ZZZZ